MDSTEKEEEEVVYEPTSTITSSSSSSKSSKSYLFIEKYESGSIVNRYITTINDTDVIADGDNSIKEFNFKLKHCKKEHNTIIETLYYMFLPNGYPHSVTSDYFGYQSWDTLQALCSNVTGVLSTRAILKGYGVGNATATVTSATTQFIIRDGFSMIGRVWFATKKGTELDCNSKTWRFLADILNDLGMTLEMISPWHPTLFLPLSSLGIIFKSICGVAGGCTKASLTQHFAKRDNLADVSAKDGSQETAIGLVGMILGMVVTTIVPEESIMLTWMAFIPFILLHLFCNYKAVSNVKLNSINRYRALLIYKYYTRTGQVPTPSQISKKENILFRSNDLDIKIGISIQQYQKYLEKKTNQKNIKIYRLLNNQITTEQPFIIWMISTAMHAKSKRNTRNSILISLSDKAQTIDIIKAYFYSISLIIPSKYPIKSATFFDQLLHQGWNLDRNLLNCDGWRYKSK
eukprot:gene2299-2836_t